MNSRMLAAYGRGFQLRADSPAALERLCAAAPFGWQVSPDTAADVCYSLARPPAAAEAAYELSCDSELIARAPDLGAILAAFNRHAELLTATLARGYLFVHAGVVGWRGRAIVIPGRSFSGKTTLVKALVEAGATYYSDEFAIFDQAGLAHPYPLPLSLRDSAGQPIGKLAAASLGRPVGAEPLPAGLVLVTRYQAGARWRPRPLPAAQALLALMDNTVAAQRDPGHSMPILRQVATGAACLQTKRGESAGAARALLKRLSA